MQADEAGEELRPDYNVAPTKKIYAVMTRRPPGLAGDGGVDGSSGDGEAAARAGQPSRREARRRRPGRSLLVHRLLLSDFAVP